MIRIFVVVSITFVIICFKFCDCERPNIVFIIADDLGWNDVGFNSGDVATPNIDALAYHGVILTRHYAQPVCSPSRAALLTGDYPLRHGFQGGPCIAGVHDGLPTDVKIMPQYFSKLGYKSHLVGKWHLGYETPENLPTRRGFNSFFGYLNGYLGYWDSTHFSRGIAGRDMRRNEEKAWSESYGRYLTGVLTEEAVRVILDHEKEDGLLLVLSHAAVHTTYQDIMREAPLGVRNVTGRGYLRAMVEWLDRSVGEVFEALQNKGFLNNTILVFISDNGAPSQAEAFANGGSNWPLRGEKESIHEGGVRTIATIWSPLIKNSSRISEQYFHISDWLPTLYAAAGGRPEDLESKDGVNQWLSLKTSEQDGTRDTIIINIDDKLETEAVIKNKWKLIKNNNPKTRAVNVDHYYGESGSWMTYDLEEVRNSLVAQVLGPLPENHRQLRQGATVQSRCVNETSAMSEDCHSKYCLFDIISDPTECHDVAEEHEDVVRDLEAILDGYRTSLVAAVPKYFDRRASPKRWNDYWSPWLRQ